MATTYTSRAKLAKPALNDSGWSTPLNANADALDAVAAVGGLCVTTTEVPSAALTVAVAAGSFRASTGLFASYAGTGSQALTLSATNYLYLTDAGVLTVNTTGFPTATAHVPLAVVTTGATTVTGVTDARKPFSSAGGPATSGAAQAAVGSLTTAALTDSSGGTASTTIAAATNTTALTDSTGGTSSTTLAAVSDGPTANALASLAAELALQRSLNTVLINAVASLAAQVNHAAADLASIKTLANALQAALVTTHQIKGSA